MAERIGPEQPRVWVKITDAITGKSKSLTIRGGSIDDVESQLKVIYDINETTVEAIPPAATDGGNN